MDCPGEIMIYNSDIRSYRDLPLRYCEIGRLFRNEQSGELNGLLRVQEITQDDAHIFAALDQAESEISTIIEMVDEAYKMFDLDYEMVLSTRPESFAGDPEKWDIAEKALEKSIKDSGSEVIIEEGEGAFYGPKIDFMVRDSLGRRWQLATIQLDFFMPEKFDLSYIDSKGKKQRPVIIHRVIFGSLERFIGILLEHLEGKLPFWLAPVQVKILPISDKFNNYAEKVKKYLSDNGIERVLVEDSNDSLSKKIREGEKEKIPYLLVVGQREESKEEVSVRDREKGDIGSKNLDQFIELS
jgi:threonyl-tRNA synthetase